MARVVVADKSGACFGVERALKLVTEAASEATGGVYTLGPLIHNPRVVADLEAAGVSVSQTDELEPGSTLVLRTHGVTEAVERAASERGLEVLDATCPFVRRVHRDAARLESEGYDVIVVGEPGHAEVEGIVGHTERARVVERVENVDALELGSKVGVVCQTTQDPALFRAVVDRLLARAREVRAINTICDATNERQVAARALAAQADAMVVIGGRMSGNTRRLAQIATQECANTHHIEAADELVPSWFDGCELVGVTAGASTPASHIDEVVGALRDIVGD